MVLRVGSTLQTRQEQEPHSRDEVCGPVWCIARLAERSQSPSDEGVCAMSSDVVRLARAMDENTRTIMAMMARSSSIWTVTTSRATSDLADMSPKPTVA